MKIFLRILTLVAGLVIMPTTQSHAQDDDEEWWNRTPTVDPYYLSELKRYKFGDCPDL